MRSGNLFVLPLGLAVAMALPGPLMAGSELFRFGALHGEAGWQETVSGLRGMSLEGVEISLKNGKLTVLAAKARLDDQTTATGIAAGTTLVLDDGFFQAPVTGVVNAFRKSSSVAIQRLELYWSEDGPEASSTTQESVAVKDIQLHTHEGEFTMEGRSLVSIKATGRLHWHPAEKQLRAEITSVKAAGLPVPLSLAFGLMAKFVNQPFVRLENPDMWVDVGWFLK